MAVRSATINVIERAVRRAARGLVKDFGEVENLQVSQKGPSDFVSTADKNAEASLQVDLAKARPSFGFLLEEGGEIKGTEADTRWIIDPLDGTTNFLHGVPHFCISVALERAGEIVAGVIHDPTRDEFFWAEKGVGAYLNDRRIRVSGRRNLQQSLLATGIPFHGHGDHEGFSAQLNAVMPKVAGVRRFGAAALDLAYVAAGRYEAYWERGISAWDVAAGTLLVKEAGGFVSEIDGGRDIIYGKNILASNAHLHAPIGKLLRGKS
ncbi:MAG: inositol monophosphatase family protein [Pseudomonadota bacterium]